MIELDDVKSDAVHAEKVKRPEEPQKAPHGGLFLKGPIPWAWLEQAGRLTGKTLQVAVVIRLLAGMKKKSTVRVGPKYLREMGVGRTSGYRAIGKLEQSGLITVKRMRGRSPDVTVVEVPRLAAGKGVRQGGQPAPGPPS